MAHLLFSARDEWNIVLHVGEIVLGIRSDFVTPSILARNVSGSVANVKLICGLAVWPLFKYPRGFTGILSAFGVWSGCDPQSGSVSFNIGTPAPDAPVRVSFRGMQRPLRHPALRPDDCDIPRRRRARHFLKNVVEEHETVGVAPEKRDRVAIFVSHGQPYGAPASVFSSKHISGGSSSGSAVAVAAGLVSFSLGTDTAGSGRVPAAFNNIVGLKPTLGLLSTRGVVPACRSLDCVSIFALTADDARDVLAVAKGFDAGGPVLAP